MHLTGSLSALDVRNMSQWYQKTIPMLRLIPQLLRSSEIEMFEGQRVPSEEILASIPPGGEGLGGWAQRSIHSISGNRGILSRFWLGVRDHL